MAKYIKNAFGVSGDLTTIPDDTQVSGDVSFEQGYTNFYQLDPATDPSAKRIERAKQNYLFNIMSANIKEWQEQTYPDWIADAGSGTPFSYSKYAIVTYTDGLPYISTIDANTGEPTVDITDWVMLEDWLIALIQANSVGRDVATATEIRTGTDNEKVITPFGYNLTTLGWGQTWQVVTGSRAIGLTYTNTSGRPIEVQVTITNTTNFTMRMQVGGVILNGQTSENSTYENTVTAIVPNNTEYIVNTGGTPVLLKWVELR